MQIETNNSSAKFTRPTTIVMSSKSGTNQVHGALFYTNRNSGYGVARQRQDNFTKPPYLNRNEFGGSVGGPVYIPKIYNGRNRTFFFFSWEDIRSLSRRRSFRRFRPTPCETATSAASPTARAGRITSTIRLPRISQLPELASR